eukprot:6791150-Pyramimonas_sp.AAC.1
MDGRAMQRQPRRWREWLHKRATPTIPILTPGHPSPPAARETTRRGPGRASDAKSMSEAQAQNIRDRIAAAGARAD